ncbi:MAG: histidine phosphatase family protein [Rhodobacteraceae bacterium]|nr:histidine phosphatase family protein [Paracoccaceae bacterium]
MRHVNLALLALLLAAPARAEETGAVALAKGIGADVIFLRHALAPGTGDPAGFRLEDCATQRNLSDEGRAQARAIGEALRASGLQIAEVMSSQWCRARETAVLMDLGAVVEEPGLNSFFGNPDARQPTLDLLTDRLASLPEGAEAGLTVMVTHQVVISAVTGRSTASGAAVLYDIDTGAAEPLPLPGTETN